MTQKIVINGCYGGFSYSQRASDHMSVEWDGYGFQTKEERDEIKRNDPRLVRAVEALGGEASGTHAALLIVEIPDGVEWEIEEYDGIEWVSEKHRTWGRDEEEE